MENSNTAKYRKYWGSRTSSSSGMDLENWNSSFAPPPSRSLAMNHHYYNIDCVLIINTALFLKQKDQPEVGRERNLLEYFKQVKYLGEDTNLIPTYIEKWMMKNTFLTFAHLRHSSTAILKVLVVTN